MNSRLKLSIEEPPDLELKALPEHLEYTFLGEELKLPVMIVAGLPNKQKGKLLEVLRKLMSALYIHVFILKPIISFVLKHTFVQIAVLFRVCLLFVQELGLNATWSEIGKKAK